MFSYKFMGRCTKCGMEKIMVNSKSDRCPLCSGRLILTKKPRRKSRS